MPTTWGSTQINLGYLKVAEVTVVVEAGHKHLALVMPLWGLRDLEKVLKIVN